MPCFFDGMVSRLFLKRLSAWQKSIWCSLAIRSPTLTRSYRSTWYTGSGSWLYRAGLEAILGFHVRGDALLLQPCIPPAWPGFGITYRHGASEYRIEVDNAAQTGRGVVAVELDGQPLPVDPCCIPLSDDGALHEVKVTLGRTG